MTSRGLGYPSLHDRMLKFGLGFVDEPLVGHENYRGMLAIPYRRWAPGHPWSVVSMRFRCLKEHDHQNHGKYMSLPGYRPRLFNTVALTEPSDYVCITEGEIDAITAQVSGVPAVGVAGAHCWQDHFPELFRGYQTVYVLTDGDEAGWKFGERVAADLSNAKVVPFSDGEDVNSFVAKNGPQALLEHIGRLK